jgi:hypothetical protein
LDSGATRFSRRRHLGADFQVRLGIDQQAQALAHDRMIVDQHDAGRLRTV